MSVSFVQPEYIVEEVAGLQSVCVRLDSGVVERRVIISLSTTDDDAAGKLSTILYSAWWCINVISIKDCPLLQLLVYIPFLGEPL